MVEGVTGGVPLDTLFPQRHAIHYLSLRTTIPFHMTLSIKLTNLHNISKETTKRKERDSSVEENTTDTTKVLTNKRNQRAIQKTDPITI